MKPEGQGFMLIPKLHTESARFPNVYKRYKLLRLEFNVFPNLTLTCISVLPQYPHEFSSPASWEVAPEHGMLIPEVCAVLRAPLAHDSSHILPRRALTDLEPAHNGSPHSAAEIRLHLQLNAEYIR